MESGFTEFLQQLPPILPIALCLSGLMLVVILIVIVTSRARRGRSAYANPLPMATPAAAIGDLPDLDMLLRPAAGTPVTPVTAAAPVDAAEPVTAPMITPAVTSEPPLVAPSPVAAPRRPSTYTLELSNGHSIEATDVLSIARDMTDGSLIIQIGDRAYRNASEIEGENARKRFNSTIRELARQAMAADKQNAPSASTTALVPTDAAPAAPPASAAPERSPYARPVNAAPAGSMPGDLPRFNTSDTPLLTPRKRNAPPPPPVPELNIADAIETYLQFKISQTPQYVGRHIHVHPAPGGGVSIEVDGQYFETVGEVTNVEVRNFLAATIEEWQSRQ